MVGDIYYASGKGTGQQRPGSAVFGSYHDGKIVGNPF